MRGETREGEMKEGVRAPRAQAKGLALQTEEEGSGSSCRLSPTSLFPVVFGPLRPLLWRSNMGMGTFTLLSLG